MVTLLSVSFLGFLLVPPVMFSGMVSISHRNVKKHQFRMLTGFGLFTASLFVFWSQFYVNSPLYTGDSTEAFGLLFWVQLGLGLAALILGTITLWGVLENAWELHRRTGMFTFFSATVSSVLTIIMIIMIWSA